MAHQQHLLEHFFDLVSMTAHELRQGGKVRNGIAGQRLEDNVGLAKPLYLVVGGDALGIGKQDDLWRYGRIVGQLPGVFLAVLGMKKVTGPTCARSDSAPRTQKGPG